MTDTKEILQKLDALRRRLDGVANPLRAIEDKLRKGAEQDQLLETSLPIGGVGEAPATLRLTSRGARLLRQGRELLQVLRKIAEDPDFLGAGDDALQGWHRDGLALIEVVLRSVQAMPASVSAQLRMCDGLAVVLTEVEERIARTGGSLAQARQASSRIDELADLLHRLAGKKAVRLPQLQGLADTILEEARAGQPLRFWYAAPSDPSRFAAAHGLNVAQVLARLLRDDTDWQPQLQLALMAALVHDVGMARVPAEVLTCAGPLDAEQRRLIEKHTVVAEAMLTKLWPGGGWPVEVALCHHERSDGTGYPLGRTGIQVADFVRILAVCDVYAALCAPRPHRPAFDTRTALTETLLLAERDYLDKAAAERLLLLSFFPVGSAVELNDGAIGLVIATHSGEAGLSHPDRPIVLLARDAQGQAPHWPMVVDLLARSERRILRSLSSEERRATLGNLHAQLTPS